MSLPPALPAVFSAQIRTAREWAQERRRTPEQERLATAAAGLDRLLAGGLGRGSMVELVGGRSSGRFALVLSALAATTGRGEVAALVDLGDGLDPRVAAAAGVDPERLLWVRPRDVKEALASTEVILTSGLPLVVLELGLPPLRGGRGAEAAWLRLARTAQTHRVALLIASPYRMSGTAAQVVITAQEQRVLWRGHGAAPRLLRGICSQLDLVKSREQLRGPGCETLTLRLADDLAGAGDERTTTVVPFRPRRATVARTPSPVRAAA